MKAVVGHTYRGVKAKLPGYAIYKIKNAEYPGAVFDPESEISGVLYAELSDVDLAILDVFEGELYRRSLLKVVLQSGEIIDSWLYVVREDLRKYLTVEPWDLKAFVKDGLKSFMEIFVNARREVFGKNRCKMRE
jgi:hypothetical protein